MIDKMRDFLTGCPLARAVQNVQDEVGSQSCVSIFSKPEITTK